MIQKTYFFLRLANIVLLIFVAASAAWAENHTCTVIDARPDEGKYLIEIDGEKLIAITKEKAAENKQVKVDLDAARKTLDEKDQIIAHYEELIENYKTTLNNAREYIVEVNKQIEDYEKLVKKYKKLKEPWLRVEAGVGATGTDPKPAAMVGLGIKSFRVWGFFQEDNFGGLVGASLPLW